MPESEMLPPIPENIITNTKDVETMTPQEKNKAIVDNYKRLYLKRYNIEHVEDLEAEFKLIQKKESKLSRSQRDAVVAAMQIFPIIEKQAEKQNEVENLPVGEPLTKEEAEEAIAAAQEKAE